MWAQIINAFLGIWLMAAPAVLGFSEAEATNAYITGPIVTTFAAIAIFEATRPVRWGNVPLGAWLLLAPWVLGYQNTSAILNDMAVGVAVIGFALVKGTITERFGGGWRSIFKTDTPHAREARKLPRWQKE